MMTSKTRLIPVVVLAAAALLSAAGARAQAPKPNFDKDAAVVSAQLQDLEAFKKKGAAMLAAAAAEAAKPRAAEVPEGVKVLADRRKAEYSRCVDTKSGVTDHGILNAVNDEAACRALADGDPGVCASAGPREKRCRQLYGRLLVDKALITGDPNFLSICLKAESEDEKHAASGMRAVVCKHLASKQPAEVICRELTPQIQKSGDPTLDEPKCQAYIRAFRGEQADCRALAGPALVAAPNEKEKQREPGDCAVSYAFRKAWTSKNPAACGKSALCLALMGRPAAQACVPAQEQVRQAKLKECKRLLDLAMMADKPREGTIVAMSSGKPDPSSNPPFRALADEVKTTLADVKGMPSGPEASAYQDLYQASRSSAPTLGGSTLLMHILLVKQGTVKRGLDNLQAQLESFEPKTSEVYKARAEQVASLRKRAQAANKPLVDGRPKDKAQAPPPGNKP